MFLVVQSVFSGSQSQKHSSGICSVLLALIHSWEEATPKDKKLRSFCPTAFFLVLTRKGRVEKHKCTSQEPEECTFVQSLSLDKGWVCVEQGKSLHRELCCGWQPRASSARLSPAARAGAALPNVSKGQPKHCSHTDLAGTLAFCRMKTVLVCPPMMMPQKEVHTPHSANTFPLSLSLALLAWSWNRL